MVQRLRTSLERGINYYVPRMSYDGALVHGQGVFSLGTPAAAAAGAVQAAAFNAVNQPAGTKTNLTTAWTADSPYGRNVVPVISADPGASNAEFDVCGYDYLGQPMAEKFTVASGGTTMVPAAGVKCFYRITHVINRIDTTNAVTLAIGTGAVLGLPFKGAPLWAREAGVYIAPDALIGSGDNYTSPVLTDPQTGVTGDPRGRYSPDTFGVLVEVGLHGDSSYNANGNGGLHGIRHWAPSDF